MSSSLKNKVIVITRSNEQVEEPTKKLESLGAKVIHFPTISIEPLKAFNLFDTYTNNLADFDYIIFTSENAVQYSAKRLDEINKTLPGSLRIVCVGKKTAQKCKEFGITVDIIPDDYSARGLLNYFSDKNLLKKKFFIPSSVIARTELKTGLIELGADVIQTPIYDVGLPGDVEIDKSKYLLKETNPDLFIFTSPSTFNNFVEIMEIDEPKKYFENLNVAAIGPTTSAALNDFGVSADIVPDNYTMDSLIDSIITFYSM